MTMPSKPNTNFAAADFTASNANPLLPINGWGTSTGGARGQITGAATLPQVAAALAQLLEDLKAARIIDA